MGDEERAVVEDDMGSRRDDFLDEDTAVGFLADGAAFVDRFAAVSGMAVTAMKRGERSTSRACRGDNAANSTLLLIPWCWRRGGQSECRLDGGMAARRAVRLCCRLTGVTWPLRLLRVRD
jgi:hypothetical protein